jgi:anaerobic ribonucleoside-triphosphate reductase
MNHIIKQNEIKETYSSLQIPVEVYSRVVGYYRPVNQWHAGKQQEFKERVCLKFDVKIFK